MRSLILIACVVMCGGAAAGDLAGADLKDALVGQTLQWWETDGWRYGHMTLLPDGRAEITLDAPVAQHDEGQWRISGSQLCTSWSSLRGRDTKCYSVQRTAPDRFMTSGGNVFVVVSAGV